MKYDVYAYGMILASTSFLLDSFIKPDNYTEIKEKYRLVGGETGTCATVLASLGANVKLDGNHIGKNVATLLKEFYKDKSVDLSSLNFDENYDGLEDYIIIADDFRSPMGTFANFYSNGEMRWNAPKEDDIINCTVAAIDPFFWNQAPVAAEYCVRHSKPYVTIDCRHDSYIHKNSAVTVISSEGIANNDYTDKTHEKLMELFTESSDGLTIITNGSKSFYYGRKGEPFKTFEPYKVDVVSTLGAGDSFKAGCTYALLKGMDDDELVKFASACSAVAITKFPLPLNPPTLDKILKLIHNA